MLIDFVNGKIEEKPYFLNAKEKANYFDVISYALMSQGPLSGITPRLHINGKVEILASDVHHFALMLMNINGDKLILKYPGRTYEVESKQLWKLLLKYLIQLFPKSLSEALSRSKEMPKGEARLPGFTFKSDEKIKE